MRFASGDAGLLVLTVAAALSLAVATWLAAAIVYQIGSQLALARFLRRRRSAGRTLPTCAILRPLRGANPRIEANLELLLSLAAPVVVGVEDESDAAGTPARREGARRPDARMSSAM